MYRPKHASKRQERILLISTAVILIIGLAVLYFTLQANSKDMQTQEPSGTMIRFETTKGTILVELYDNDAPITTFNFKQLVEQGFYDNLTFHRYEPGFVIQGGDPRGDGTGGSSKRIPLETNPKLVHEAGVIAMARSSDPNSASSQFYFTLAPAHFLDGNYAVFGHVVEGMDVVLALRKGDRMTKVEQVE